MELVSNLALGFSVSLHPINLLFGFAGVALGVIIGILPGLGSAATIALLLPITYFLDTTTAVIMLAGIWYGIDQTGSRRRRAWHVDLQRLHRRHVRPSGARPDRADACRIRP
jgi:TctA family transporter